MVFKEREQVLKFEGKATELDIRKVKGEGLEGNRCLRLREKVLEI